MSACVKASDRLLRILLIISGTFFVGIGVIGIFLPLLPTTPFLLLAAACYARGSKRFYNWLLNNRLFGDYIKNYREGKGIPLKVKVISIVLLWVTIGYAAIYIMPIFIGKLILFLIGIGVALHIIKIKTLEKEEKHV